MSVVEIVTLDRRGRKVWETRVELQGLRQISIGRSSLFDVVCPCLPLSDYLLVSISRGFLLVTSDQLECLGLYQCDFRDRRGRIFQFRLKESSPIIELSGNGQINFFDASVLECLPDFSKYLNSQMRMSVAAILSDRRIFHSTPESADALTNGVVVAVINRFLMDLRSRISLPFDRLSWWVDCFWIAASYIWAEGPLTALLRHSEVSEVLLNGHDELWIEDSSGLHKVMSPFVSWDDLWAWLSKQADLAGTELVGPRGCSDFSLRSGARVHVVLAPLSRKEGYVSLRVHRSHAPTLDELILQGALNADQGQNLKNLICERKNVLVAGATSSGKTTLLRALAGCCRPQDRIVVLEDVAEIRLPLNHAVYLQTYESEDTQQKISLESLVRESLRMRPDRIIVGECRGNEAFALIQALHTGHRGSFATLHANSPVDALLRLEALMMRAEPSLNPSVARKLINNAFDVVVFMVRRGDSARVVSGIFRMDEVASCSMEI